MKIYSIKDVKSGFMSLMTLKNDAMAIRSFKNLLNDPHPNLVSMNPEDFELWCLGSFDIECGKIESAVSFVCNSDVKYDD